MAVTYVLLWIVPPGLSSTALALYYLGAYFLFDLFMTIVTGPYYALMPELSLDSDERTSIVTYRMATSIITGLGAAVALPVVFNAAPSLRVGLRLGGRRRRYLERLALPADLARVSASEPDFQAPPRLGIGQSIRIVLRSRPFWLAMLVKWLAWLAIAIVEAVFAYYVVYWAGIPEEELGHRAGRHPGERHRSSCRSSTGWPARLEKKWAFVVATLTWAVTHVILWFVPQMQRRPGLPGGRARRARRRFCAHPADLDGGGCDGGDRDRQRRAPGRRVRRRHDLPAEAGNSVALLVIGWVLELTGYRAGAATQGAATLTGLRVLVSWVPVVLLILASLCAAAFPITRRVHLGTRGSGPRRPAHPGLRSRHRRIERPGN